MGKSKQQKRKEKKVVLVFDDEERKEFLSGFSKRKKERQRKAKEKALGKLEAERKKLVEEKRNIMADIVVKGGINLTDPQNIETVKGISNTVEMDEHTVTITEFTDDYGAVKSLVADESGIELADLSDAEDPLEMPGGTGSAVDSNKIRLKQIAEELKDFSCQMQPIRASLNEKVKKQKKRQQRARDKREQEDLQKKRTLHNKLKGRSKEAMRKANPRH